MATAVDFTNQSFAPLKNDLILRVARGERAKRVPVWVLKQAGKYLPEYKELRGNRKFFDICKDPELVCDITVQPVKRYNVDAAIIFSDILIIPVAMGLKVANQPGQGPVFADPITCPEDLKRISADFDIVSQLGWVYEAITLARRKLEGEVPLIGFTGSSWSIMKYMIENASSGGPFANHARKFLVEHPEASHQLLTMITDVVVKHIVHQVKAGAQIIQVFDPYAGDMGPLLFSEFDLPSLRQIAKNVKDKLRQINMEPVPMIIFAKKVPYAIEELSKAGYDVVALDYCVEPRRAREAAGNVTLQGNLDPVMMFGTKDEIQSAVKEMMEQFGTQHYIANVGLGLLGDTDPDKVATFVDAVHTCSKYMNASS